MRLLIVSNLYPPHVRGGYEIRCRQLAEAASQAGHDVHVLTSVFGASPTSATRSPDAESAGGVRVYRWLDQYVFPPFADRRPWRYWRARREIADADRFRSVVERIRPDVVNWWSMLGLAKLILPLPAGAGIPDVHWIEQAWMPDEYGCDGRVEQGFWSTFWSGTWGPRPLRPLARPLLRAWESRVRTRGIPTRDFPNMPRHVVHVSRFMQELHHARGCRFPSEEVIHGGAPESEFLHERAGWTRAPAPLRLLYVGQLTPDRGLETLLRALQMLEPAVREAVALTVAGDGPSEHVAHLRRVAGQPDLARCVSFVGRVPHAAVAALYRGHDVLCFPSARDEGMPLTLVEAMLSGCAVLTTASGGAGEVAMLAGLSAVPAGDAREWAARIASLVGNRDHVAAIAINGQRAARAHFSLERTVAQYLAMLERVAAA